MSKVTATIITDAAVIETSVLIRRSQLLKDDNHDRVAHYEYRDDSPQQENIKA